MENREQFEVNEIHFTEDGQEVIRFVIRDNVASDGDGEYGSGDLMCVTNARNEIMVFRSYRVALSLCNAYNTGGTIRDVMERVGLRTL